MFTLKIKSQNLGKKERKNIIAKIFTLKAMPELVELMINIVVTLKGEA